METSVYGLKSMLCYMSLAIAVVTVGYEKITEGRISNLVRCRLLQTTEQILLNLQLVAEMLDDENEVQVDPLEEAPLHTFDKNSKIIYVKDQTSLINAMKHMSEKEWIGVDMEHSKKYAYHGLLCLIQISVYDSETNSYTTYLIDTIDF